MDVIYEGPQKAYRRMIEMGDDTHAERVIAHPPFALLTDSDGKGEYSRIRVDVGQTGFFAGREFRTLHEIAIATGATEVIKVVSTVDTIVEMFSAEIISAKLRVELRVGGTEGGTFNTALPIFKTNTMTTASAYTTNVTMNVGGTHTGGTLVDLLLLKSGDGTSKSKDIATSAIEGLPQGFAAGTFYIKLINTDGATVNGIFKARWEERPTGV
jgi:hypothetical protein